MAENEMDYTFDDETIEDDIISDDILSRTTDKNNIMNDFQNIPSIENVMNLIENMKDLSDEDRHKLKMSLIESQNEAKDKLSQYASAQSAIAGNDPSINDYMIFIAMVTLIIAVFVLFGYKLYKSLVEKQKRREEKLKAKQSKKKK